jgi:glycosyltransferase involved in cell wall biosynthesis
MPLILERLKRIPDVIKIFKEVNDKIPSRLMLVGDGLKDLLPKIFAAS